MINQPQIEAFLKPALSKLEVERKQIKKDIQWNIFESFIKRIVVGTCTILVIAGLNHLLEHSILYFMILALVPITIFYALDSILTPSPKNIKLAKDFELRVKEELFSQVFKQWNATAVYKPYRGIDQAVFNLVGDHRFYNTYLSDDYVEGILEDGRKFFFSEIYQSHITGNESDYLNQQRSLLVVIKESCLLEEHPATIRITTNTAPEKKKSFFNSKKHKAPSKNIENILDADYSPPNSLDENSLLEGKFHLENLNSTPILPLLSQQWQQQLQHLQQLVRDELVLLSQDNTCYLWVKHNTEFWKIPIKTPLTEPLLRKTLAWNFARVFILVDYLSKLTVKIP